MNHPEQADLAALIKALHDANVEFVVVGGAAAVLHGAPTTTQDLDIVHNRTPENIERFIALLDQLDAYIREPGNRKIKPVAKMLAGKGQLNLSTILGPLDPLCELHDGRGYAELLSESENVTSGNQKIRILDLPALINIKSKTGRAKDFLIVPLLIALMEKRKEDQ